MTAQHFLLTDHVCLACFGRVLESAPLGTPRVFRCADCGIEAPAKGSTPPICACNARLGSRDAGIRCVANPRPRPELPSEILARELR